MYFPNFSAKFELFQQQKGMKFGFIISVHDSRQRTHSKIHETCKIPAFPASERHEIRTQLYLSGTRTLDLAKSTQKGMNLQHFQNLHSMTPSSALIDPQLSMTKGSSFSFFHTIRTFYSHSKTISLNLSSFKTMYLIL